MEFSDEHDDTLEIEGHGSQESCEGSRSKNGRNSGIGLNHDITFELRMPIFSEEQKAQVSKNSACITKSSQRYTDKNLKDEGIDEPLI